MLYDKFDKLIHTVPDIHRYDFNDSKNLKEEVPKKIIIDQRISTLMLLNTSVVYPASMLPPKEYFFSVLHQETDDLMEHVTPQQQQSISTLCQFVSRNPSMLIRALKENYKNRDRYDNYVFMIYSTIPAFFGFFSTKEHINDAFSFYCSLVGTADEKIIKDALVPFFCNGITFRFIEMVYDRFCSVFCHDFRLDTKKIQMKLLEDLYIPMMINIIKESYPLLPQTHQFILKFMGTRGWTFKKILNFFLHSFALPQLLRFVKSTPYKLHFQQMKEMAIYMGNNMNNYLEPFSDLFQSNSLFEIPDAYTTFHVSYAHLLLTPIDVDCIITSLQLINELPMSLIHFVNGQYFDKIDFKPFWIKIFSRKPAPEEMSSNWRYVVFSKEDLHPLENKSDSHYIRLWREVQMKSKKLGLHPIQLLKEKKLSYSNWKEQQKYIKLLGDKLDEFVQYCYEQSVIELQNSAQEFEQYLSYQIYFNFLTQWGNLAAKYYTIMCLPSINIKIRSILKTNIYITKKIIKQIMTFDLYKIENPQIIRYAYMMIVEKLIPLLLPNQFLRKLNNLEQNWKIHLGEIRETLTLPDYFQKSKNSKLSLLLHKQLWSSIENLRDFGTVPFHWALNIVLISLIGLTNITGNEDSESSVIQFAVAFCDSPNLISRFMLINIFVFKQKLFDILSDGNSDDLLWPRFEIAILQLLSKNSQLMNQYLAIQDELVCYEPK